MESLRLIQINFRKEKMGRYVQVLLIAYHIKKFVFIFGKKGRRSLRITYSNAYELEERKEKKKIE